MNTEKTQVKNDATEGEKMFTKEQVNNMMRKRIERSHQSFFNRYGVKDLEELDSLFGKAKQNDELTNQYTGLQTRFDELTKGNTDLQTKFDELTSQNQDLLKKYAFMSKNVKPELYSDIETYFKGKGLDINEDTLSEELKTHMDWCKKADVIPLSNEPNTHTEMDEKEMAGKLLGVEL